MDAVSVTPFRAFGAPRVWWGRRWSRSRVRTYIGGNFPNTPDTLMHWIMAPQAMKPKTAMPTLGLSQPQARDVVAYLETLQ